MSEIAISFAVLAALVVLFVWNRFPVELVAIAGALALYATGILDLTQTLAGFGDPTVLFIASLFVVSEGLDAGGVTTWAGQQLISLAGASRARLLVLTMLLVALLTALISVNGAVAALLPVVVVMAVRLNQFPSQLLLPLVFAAHAGSMLTLTGTPVNVLVADAAADAGVGSFGFFEFALVGVPLVLGTVVIVVLFGRRLLPERTVRVLPADLSRHAHTLVEEYLLEDGVFWLRVRSGSPYVGRRRAALELGDDPALRLVGVQAGDQSGPVDGAIRVGDLLIVRGDAETVGRLAADHGLGIRSVPEADQVAGILLGRSVGLAEVVVPPRSDLVGETVDPGMVTSSGDLVILAVQRKGEDRGPTATRLAVGDTLLLQGSWDALDENLDDPDVLVVDSPELVRRQAVPLGPGGKRATAVLAAMVLLLATGAVPAVVAGLLAAGAMILLGVITLEQAYRGINWTTVVLVGAMIPMSVAMQVTGAAERIATALVDVVGDASPYLLLLGVALLTSAFGQLISNMATAIIVIPIALSAAAELGVSARPVLMCVTVAAAAAFLTPVATPVNLMVMGPGGYRFGDYWKLGLPLLLLFLVVATFLVPVFWPF
ncbi:MAG TPA: SLC13 family permease [Actinomycetes bacterium]|nr:SLC13 family permease [Actinomycetes bacterium]